MKILVDGLNFELQRGTGIKTYTRSVLAALHEDGHSIDLLSQQSIAKIRHVLPLDAYLTSILQSASPANGRKRIRDRMVQHLALFGRSFKGDISVHGSQGAQLLRRYQNEEWDYIDRIRVAPGIFLRSFTRAGLGLGINNISGCRDDEVLFLSSPIPIRLRGRMNILTVHDIIPLSHPWLMDRWSTIAKAVGKTLEYTLKTADKVICVSNATKLELLNRFSVDERKLHVLYQPCRYSLSDELEGSEGDQSLLEGLGLEKESYILFVGAIEPKKNLFNLLKAIEQNKALPKLVIVGQFAWSSSRERAMIANLQGRVQHLGYLPDRELELVLKNASAFVFPSITEGFGLPALEAMWKGVPCVLSDIPVFRELFGDHAQFVDPHDPTSISDGIQQVVFKNKATAHMAMNYVRTKFSLTQFKKGLNHVVKT